MKIKTCCPACGGQLVLHRVGNYADDYMINLNGSVRRKRIRRNVYLTAIDLSSVYCDKCHETYTDFKIDRNNRLILT
jgi:hypothetical protein